jgi:uncharacterized protein (TIGR04141 family)
LRRGWERRIPADKPDSGDYQVVFAILGVPEEHPKADLPFFCQLNVVRTYEGVAALGKWVRDTRRSNDCMMPRLQGVS